MKTVKGLLLLTATLVCISGFAQAADRIVIAEMIANTS
jgi:hypothetical protein